MDQPTNMQQAPVEEPNMQQQPSGGDFEMQDASPEEKEQYERFVGRAFQFMYSEKMRGSVKEMLAGEGDPIEGLAKTAAMITARVALAAEKAGEKLMGDVVWAAGKEILEDLAEFSQRWKIKDYSQDPKALEGAYFRALDEFRLMMKQAGRLNPEEYAGDMERLSAMNESGELDSVLRRLAESERPAQNAEVAGEPESEMEDEGEDPAMEQKPPRRGLGVAMGGRR